MTEVEAEISSNANGGAIGHDHKLKLVGIFALIALHHKIFHTVDKRLNNKLWDLCKKVREKSLDSK